MHSESDFEIKKQKQWAGKVVKKMERSRSGYQNYLTDKSSGLSIFADARIDK